MRGKVDSLSGPAWRPWDLEHRVSRRAAVMEHDSVMSARREARDDLAMLIHRIRRVDSFRTFLRAPSVHELALQASDGPIIYVYAGPSSCGALVLSGEQGAPVRAITLDNLTEEDARWHANQFVRARSASNAADRLAFQKDLLSTLKWMWDTIAEPILAALGYTAMPVGPVWPRIWWCPVGIFAYLPLHAAGHHEDHFADDAGLRAHPRAVLDRVVSSYTGTVQGLRCAREQAAEVEPRPMLVVVVPDAPGVRSLPLAAAEAEAIRRLFPDAQVLLDPDREQVLAALRTHSAAHFACHGYAELGESSASMLVLADYMTSPLTVADVTKLRLNGILAYLSACETTLTAQHLADESVHLTGAFFLAGYQHVIGTLWLVADSSAKDIATEFYGGLTGEGDTRPRFAQSAFALHMAVRKMRARYPDLRGQRSPNKMIAWCGVLYLDRQTKPWTVLACFRSQWAQALVWAYSWPSARSSQSSGWQMLAKSMASVSESMVSGTVVVSEDSTLPLTPARGSWRLRPRNWRPRSSASHSAVSGVRPA